ncbi:helix-turn-helix transcriptional regulator [Streptomyces sodiiphilus]|uniref:Helix-turn-helix transcriptional regulator n=1 Tax=Streptomyces sodiiphilus TaxID=226217 RepID=A0ABN2PGV0_9ACTN
MYSERPSRLPDTTVWQRTHSPGGEVRVLPDGCLDLLWHDGELLVAGPDSRAQLSRDRPGANWAGLRFARGTGPAVLGVPAAPLRDLRVPLAALWPGHEVRELAERVAGAPCPAAALEAAAARRLRASGPPEPWCRVAADMLDRGARVAELAHATGWSERHLRRRFLASFGYGPKTLARVLRLQRALELVRAGTPPAAAAARSGYADQAHMSREVRSLTGMPLTRLR